MNIFERALHGDMQAVEVLLANRDESGHAPLTISDVCGVLQQFVNSEISSEHLKKWADLLLFNDSFKVENWKSDEEADKLDPVWDILHWIASPETEGKFTVKEAKQALVELAKFA